MSRDILKLNIQTKKRRTSRNMRRKENQEKLAMMTHQTPLQVKMKKPMMTKKEDDSSSENYGWQSGAGHAGRPAGKKRGAD